MRHSPLYILPNLFTAAGLFLGVLSIIYASNDKVVMACWFIIASMVFDGLDGRVARMTGTTSKFGVEFDSLADVVSFGVAPAMVLYLYTGHDYAKVGALISCLFVIFGAMRLARFNVSVGNQEPNVFIGIPIPAAALFVVSWILVYERFGLRSESPILLGATLLIAILMVSNVRFPSFKQIKLSETHKKKTLIIVVLLLSFVYVFPAVGVALMITAYVLFGLVRASYYLLTKRRSLSKKVD